MKRPTAIDAFCGAGGLSLGLARAGFEIRYAFDLDPQCINTIRANRQILDHRVKTADIGSMLNGRLLSEANLKPGDLDLLAGGPPCQGFSVQRTIGGDRDSRNLLVDDYADLILETKPRFFLLENVPGISGKRGEKILGDFLARVTRESYNCHQNILDAQFYGVPQRRRRMFIVGERVEIAPPVFEWPKGSRSKPPTVREIISKLPTPPEDGSEHPHYPGHKADRLSPINKARLRAITAGQSRIHLPKRLLANCHKISADIVGHRNVYGRMSWDAVAPTITARFDSFTRGKFGHPEQIRSISLHEGALLQTFPPNYRFIGSKVEVARQIGNAVPPALGYIIGKAIIKALQIHR